MSHKQLKYPEQNPYIFQPGPEGSREKKSAITVAMGQTQIIFFYARLQ